MPKRKPKIREASVRPHLRVERHCAFDPSEYNVRKDPHEAGAAPMMAVVVDGHAVSACFCARRSIGAAEAGLETALAFRGRGHAARVTTAWAGAVRASGRTPLYSTSWTNASSLAVARKLGLRIYAMNWSIER
jgi:hypothetical protein